MGSGCGAMVDPDFELRGAVLIYLPCWLFFLLSFLFLLKIRWGPGPSPKSATVVYIYVFSYTSTVG